MLYALYHLKTLLDRDVHLNKTLSEQMRIIMIQPWYSNTYQTDVFFIEEWLYNENNLNIWFSSMLE